MGQLTTHPPASGRDTEPVSPELALVDPELARRERARLLDADAEAGVAHERFVGLANGGQPVAATGGAGVVTIPAARSAPAGAQELPARRRHRRRLPLWASGLGVTTIVLLVLVGLALIPVDRPTLEPSTRTPGATPPSSTPAREGSRPSSGDRVRASPPPRNGKTPPSSSAGSRESGQRPATARSQGRTNEDGRTNEASDARRAAPPDGQRRFAWAPVPGAQAYEIAFYRGDELVFERRTTTPAIELPRQWRHRGRLRSLAPGTYRWYVWAVDADGRRGSAAVVQARLAVASD